MRSYTYANKVVQQLFNKPLKDIVGRDDSHFFELSIYSQLKENDAEVMKEGVTVQSEESNYLK